MLPAYCAYPLQPLESAGADCKSLCKRGYVRNMVMIRKPMWCSDLRRQRIGQRNR